MTAVLGWRMVQGMTIRRIIGLVLLSAAGLFGVADLWHSYFPTYGQDVITMGQLWLVVSARSMELVEALTERLWSPIWDLGIAPVLIAPAWSFFGVLGFLFFAFGRPKVVDR